MNKADMLVPRNGNGNEVAQGHEADSVPNVIDGLAAAIALTQKINSADFREKLRLAREAGVETIDEFEQLVAISESIRVEPVDTRTQMVRGVDAGITVESAGAEAILSTAVVEPESPSPEEVVAKTGPTERYSDHFKLPETKMHKGELSRQSVLLEGVVDMLDGMYERDGGVEILSDPSNTRSSAIRVLLHLVEDYMGTGLTASDKNNFTTTFNRLVDCGYLEVDRETYGSRNHSTVTAIRLGSPAPVEELKKK